VLISSFNLDNEDYLSNTTRQWKAKFFHNFPGSDSDGMELVLDVAIRTANAPTYFPIFQGYIDGGVVANNPSMCALAQAIHPQTGGEELSEIVLISFGTGHNPHHIPVQFGNWGVLHWATKIINLVTEGSAGLADYQCRQLLGDRYLRVNPLLPYPIAMDKVDEIPRMVEIGNEFDLNEVENWVRDIYLT
jgi:patatin-like phospholipase/acyl hydrolase